VLTTPSSSTLGRGPACDGTAYLLKAKCEVIRLAQLSCQCPKEVPRGMPE